MNIRVAILGCGPSGLLAAHAARLCGAEVHIYSVKRKSRIHGAQYLHREIEGLSPRFALIYYHKVGTKQGYAEKLYGDPDEPCSWDLFQTGKHAAWSMIDVYNRLWDLWEDQINDLKVDSEVAHEIAVQGYDLCISTIPLPSICEGPHFFESKRIWVKSGDWPGFLLPVPKHVQHENIIIYNGDRKNTWYRYSNLFGHSFMEFPYGAENGSNGFKPTGHCCDCHPAWVKMGRFGKWKRGVLAHSAYEETISAMHEVLRKS